MSVKRYCHRCQQVVDRGHKHRPPDTRPSARARGYDAEHEQDRATFLAAFPVCQWPEGCLEPSTELDHIDGNPRNRDWGNYRGYCKSHHSRRTARDQPGGWNSPGYVRTYDET